MFRFNINSLLVEFELVFPSYFPKLIDKIVVNKSIISGLILEYCYYLPKIRSDTFSLNL